MNTTEEKLYKLLLDKSKEAFIMAIELYNKPTLKYRVEGFAFFVCNAWELMLKAKLIKDKGENSIYYKGTDEKRTISLENCIKLIFTNEKDPLRKNLEKIIELRNTSTHFITEEYEMVYVPLFQACAYNFTDKLQLFHNVDITLEIPIHFINLSVSCTPVLDNVIKAKYSSAVYDKLIKAQESIEKLRKETSNDRFSIVIQQDLHLTKKSELGVAVFRLAKQGEENIDGTCQIIKEIQNPNNTHPFKVKRLVELVNKGLINAKINLKFTKGNFDEFNKYFGFKDNADFCFTYNIDKNKTYSYSQRTIDFVVNEIIKDPNICNEIRRKKNETKNKLTPGARDSNP